MRNSKSFMETLTDGQRAIFYPLHSCATRVGALGRTGAVYGDVLIDTLFLCVMVSIEGYTPRQRQQHVGAYVARINKKLAAGGHKFIIRPGGRRRSYQLRPILKAAQPRARG